jgi:hypothetical protein
VAIRVRRLASSPSTRTSTGKIVIADEDPKVVLREAKGRNHVVVGGRVPYPDEPIYVY